MKASSSAAAAAAAAASHNFTLDNEATTLLTTTTPTKPMRTSSPKSLTPLSCDKTEAVQVETTKNASAALTPSTTTSSLPTVVSDKSNNFSRNSRAQQKKKVSCLPTETVEYLKTWMMSPEHIAHPYPTEQEKRVIMNETGIELKKLTNWFVNNRKRFWKPRVEAKLREQIQHGSPDTTMKGADDIVQKSADESTKKSTVSTEKDTESTTSVDASTTEATTTTQPINNIKTKNAVSPLSLIDLVEIAEAAASSKQQKTAKSSYPSSSHQQHSFLVSDQSSVAVSSDEEDDDDDITEEGEVEQQKSELITVYILQPTLGKTPTLLDVITVANPVQHGRDDDVNHLISTSIVLKTYSNCSVLYSNSTGIKKSTSPFCNASLLDDDGNDCRLTNFVITNRMVKTRNEAIGQLRQQYLSKYIIEKCCETMDDVTEIVQSSLSMKRKLNDTAANCISEDIASSPRPKYRRYSVDIWKEACSGVGGDSDTCSNTTIVAHPKHCCESHELPSLEEAAKLFGYDCPTTTTTTTITN